MPQLEITTYPSQIFWLVVSFLILYLIMSRIIIPRISSVIKNRETEIKNNIHVSEQMYKDTEIINNEYEETKKKIENEARGIINHLKETINKKNESVGFTIDTPEHNKAKKKQKARNLAKGNENPNEKKTAERMAGGPKLVGEAEMSSMQDNNLFGNAYAGSYKQLKKKIGSKAYCCFEG